MAYTQKKNGFRKITVNNIEYRWRVGQDHYSSSDTLIIQGLQPSTLVFRFRKMLIWGESEGDGVDHAFAVPVRNPDLPNAITPRFVRQSILYGLEHGWNPNERNNVMCIDWQKIHLMNLVRSNSNPQYRKINRIVLTFYSSHHSGSNANRT